MKLENLNPGLLGLGTAFGASVCCVLPMTVVLLGLGSGAFMTVTMQYRPILYPLGLLGRGHVLLAVLPLQARL